MGRAFAASLADVFEDRSDLISWRVDLFDLIRDTPNLNWLLLTKRPENVVYMMPSNKLQPGETLVQPNQGLNV